MKIINSILIFALVIVVFVTGFTGCGDSVVNSNGTTKRYQARTEADFLNGNLRAEPGTVIVLDLEDLDFIPDPEWIDTDIIGVDIIPYTYTETAEHKISIGDSSFFEIALVDEALKTVIYKLTPQNNTATVTISAGDYLLVITSLQKFGSNTLGSQTVFIQPDMTEIFARGGDFEQVDYDPNELNTLISTRRCISCNLSWVKLKNMDLSNAVLTAASLTGANLDSTNLSNANLHRAKLDYAYLNGANLNNADLSYAYMHRVNLSSAKMAYTNLNHANLNNAQLGGADFSYANLDSTQISYADMGYTILSYADLNNANLSNANLFRANLRNANLSYANLSFAYLHGANFCDAIKVGINVTGAKIGFTTQCWP